VSFNVGIARSFPGFGVGSFLAAYAQSAIALSGTAQQTKTIPASGTLTGIPGTTCGKINIKIYAGSGTSPTLTDILVQASDGTNLVPVFEYHPNVALALTTTQWFNRFFEYILDTASTTAAAGGANGQLLPGGATSFNVLTTLGGTSPGAKMDLEIIPLI
jgi:hypothetical protein